MNNVIMRKVEMRGDYRPLSDREMIGTFDLSTPPFNPGIVFFRGDDGSDVPWIAGECHMVVRCNLAELHAKGPDGAVVTVVGGTW